MAIDDLDELQAHALCRAMDFLVQHAGAVQRRVLFSMATLLNLEVDQLLLLDTRTARRWCETTWN